jgi:hypothetical protein
MPSLPFISLMLASPCREPFDHGNWLFEIKHGSIALSNVARELLNHITSQSRRVPCSA